MTDAYVKYATFAIFQLHEYRYGRDLARNTVEKVTATVKKAKFADVWDMERKTGGSYLMDGFYNLCLLRSFWDLESFIFYMERDRGQSKRFYLPRINPLQIVAHDLEDLSNRKIKFLGISLPPRVGKSTLAIFFLSWSALRRPNSHSAMGGHSGVLTKGFYKELNNLFESAEYRFAEIYKFWHEREQKVILDKSAEDLTINLGKPDRFSTITCRSIDATWTGAVDVSWDGILYVDDLVRDREHSLSPIRMENTWQEYLNKMVDRKSGYNPAADNTGIFGTEIVTRKLFEIAENDLAFRLLTQDTPHGFGFWQNDGATTLREYWGKSRSHSHPMFGAIVSCLFEYILGIRQERDSYGYEKIVISPALIEKLDRAGGHITTPKGRIAVSYEKKNGCMSYRIEIPEGATARLALIGRDEETVGAGAYEITVDLEEI